MSYLNISIVTIFTILLSSCKQSSSTMEGSVALVKSDTKISLHLDRNTKTLTHALSLYQDSASEEYITFQPLGQNRILFYDLATSTLAFTVDPKIDGGKGVGILYGYYIHNLDSIFLTNRDIQEISLIDRTADLKEKIDCEKASDGTPLSSIFSRTTLYTPLIFIDRQLYGVSVCNRFSDKNPVAVRMDLDTKTITALPFAYPKFPGADNPIKTFSVEEYVSRCYDGQHFIYSFYFDENVYITSPNHDSISTVRIKSQYINKVKVWDDYGKLTPKDVCENPNYGNILYDPYRKVYYRIAYPETELSGKLSDKELMDIFQYGRTKFSILILDKDLKVIGETLFPENTYNSQLMFIREDGLYISDSHPLNPEYSDDILSFRRFDLTQND